MSLFLIYAYKLKSNEVLRLGRDDENYGKAKVDTRPLYPNIYHAKQNLQKEKDKGVRRMMFREKLKRVFSLFTISILILLATGLGFAIGYDTKKVEYIVQTIPEKKVLDKKTLSQHTDEKKNLSPMDIQSFISKYREHLPTECSANDIYSICELILCIKKCCEINSENNTDATKNHIYNLSTLLKLLGLDIFGSQIDENAEYIPENFQYYHLEKKMRHDHKIPELTKNIIKFARIFETDMAIKHNNIIFKPPIKSEDESKKLWRELINDITKILEDIDKLR